MRALSPASERAAFILDCSPGVFVFPIETTDDDEESEESEQAVVLDALAEGPIPGSVQGLGTSSDVLGGVDQTGGC